MAVTLAWLRCGLCWNLFFLLKLEALLCGTVRTIISPSEEKRKEVTLPPSPEKTFPGILGPSHITHFSSS